MQDGEVLIQSKFISTYEDNLNGIIYKIVIIGKTIKVTIYNIAKETTVKEYIENSFIIEMDGIEYLIMDASYSNPVTKVMFSNTVYQTYVTC